MLARVDPLKIFISSPLAPVSCSNSNVYPFASIVIPDEEVSVVAIICLPVISSFVSLSYVVFESIGLFKVSPYTIPDESKNPMIAANVIFKFLFLLFLFICFANFSIIIFSPFDYFLINFFQI